MITLCDKESVVENAIFAVSGNCAMSDMLMLYLRSYGCKYNFVSFFVQVGCSGEPLCVLLRFDSDIYCHTALPINSEMYDFLSAHSGCSLYIQSQCYDLSQANNVVFGCFMQKEPDHLLPQVPEQYISDASTEPVCSKSAVHLAQQYFVNKDKSINFYLRISRMLLHNTLSLYVVIDDNDRLLSCIGVSNIGVRSYIDFLYTDEYFRGNGYARSLLSFVSRDKTVSLMCLCELEPYYESNGFTRVGDWVRLCL